MDNQLLASNGRLKTVYPIQDTPVRSKMDITIIGIGRKVPSKSTIDSCYRSRVNTVHACASANEDNVNISVIQKERTKYFHHYFVRNVKCSHINLSLRRAQTPMCLAKIKYIVKRDYLWFLRS